jgi:CRISPR/Cas system-associated exonuclease Cas4 (RecB family)
MSEFYEGLEYLPPEIKDHILRSVGDGDYQEKPNTYSLTTLLYCLRKAYYRKLYPKPLNLQGAYPIYRGRLFDDKWSPLFRHNQIRCTYRCKTVPITISGKYDFLTSSNPPVLTDLKTTGSLYYVKEPSPEYIKQVRIYAYLNSLHHAQIIYIDFKSAKIFPVAVGDVQPLLDELEEKAYTLYTALLTKTPPSREESFLCNYCEYSDMCKETP